MHARSALVLIALLSACTKSAPSTTGSSDAAPLAATGVPSASPETSGTLAPGIVSSAHTLAEVLPLDDRCVTSADCVALELFVEGDLRCCLSCGATAAASKTWASSFAEACAAQKEMRDCPVEECQRVPIDARCVAKHCFLVPRPKSSPPK